MFLHTLDLASCQCPLASDQSRAAAAASVFPALLPPWLLYHALLYYFRYFIEARN